MNNLILSIEDFKLIEQSLKDLSFDINIDDVFIINDSYIIAVKIIGIGIDKERYNQDKKNNANVDINDYIIISYKKTRDYDLNDWYDTQEKYSLKSFIHEFKNSTVLKLSEISEYKEKAKKFISGEITEQDLIDNSDDVDKDESNYLISKSSKTTLFLIQKDLEDKKKNTQLIHNFVTFEMEKKKAELEVIRERLNGVISVFKKKISKIMRVITTIELYLGIDEEIFQIQSGELAHKDTPISFRQALLYMDEETGNWNNGGLDWTDINWFDEWLIKDNNYKNVLPEEKGLVVFRPRRYKKNYYDNYYNAAMNQKNMNMTYLLIRNGDNLYRVYTENITIQPRLFPKKDELQKLLDDLKTVYKKYNSNNEKTEDEVDNLMYQYKQRAVLLQGLIDRTEIFHPLPVEKINIFEMSNLEGSVNFIYDDEATLPSGRKPFKEWKIDINNKITNGSRILIANRLSVEDRLYYYCNKHNYPPSPTVGVYEVEQYKKKTTSQIPIKDYNEFAKQKAELGLNCKITHYFGNNSKYIYDDNTTSERIEVEYETYDLTIMYNPNDTVFGGWGSYDSHERKNRIRLYIDPQEEYILNYDQISLDDINFYLTDRADRKNYLTMMPVLENIKKWRLIEIENEKNFAQMVYGSVFMHLKNLNEEKIYELIWDAIDWWKHKNLYKRPIDKDDAKALRMIVKKIKGAN